MQLYYSTLCSLLLLMNDQTQELVQIHCLLAFHPPNIPDLCNNSSITSITHATFPQLTSCPLYDIGPVHHITVLNALPLLHNVSLVHHATLHYIRSGQITPWCIPPPPCTLCPERGIIVITLQHTIPCPPSRHALCLLHEFTSFILGGRPASLTHMYPSSHKALSDCKLEGARHSVKLSAKVFVPKHLG
jgi:hypothetical protein